MKRGHLCGEDNFARSLRWPLFAGFTVPLFSQQIGVKYDDYLLFTCQKILPLIKKKRAPENVLFEILPKTQKL
jgi:hypothetical protein